MFDFISGMLTVAAGLFILSLMFWHGAEAQCQFINDVYDCEIKAEFVPVEQPKEDWRIEGWMTPN